jgi:hypothetical protein
MRSYIQLFGIVEELLLMASKCATRALGVISVRNCTRDGGGPPGAGLQEQAPHHLKLRWLRVRVVSVKDKSWIETVAGGFRETSSREPLMRCRNTVDHVEPGG